MAIRLDTSAKELYRTTNLPSSTGFTLCGWFVQRGTQSASGVVLAGLIASGGSAYNYIGYSGSNIVIATAAGSTIVAAAPSSGTPFFFALTCSGTGAGSLIGYIAERGASSLTTASRAGTSFTVNYIGISDATFGLWTNGDFGPLYIFDAVLTADQLLSQSHVIRPLWTANMNSWFPMMRMTLANNALDYSGNGRTLSSSGTPVVSDNPPLSWGRSPILFPFSEAGSMYSKDLSGSMMLAGTMTRNARKVLSGSHSIAGSLSKQGKKNPSGSLSLSGSMIKRNAKTLLGVVGTNSGISKFVLRVVSGAVVFAGTISRRAGKGLTGSVDLAGSVIRIVNKILLGSITPGGLLQSVRIYIVTLSGLVAFSGTMTKTAMKLINGIVSFAGSVSRLTSKALQGVVDLAGALLVSAVKVLNLTGAISFLGALSRRPKKGLEGAVSTVGAIWKTIGKSISGVALFIGSITKSAGKAVSGAISFIGSLTIIRQFMVFIAGSVLLEGSLRKRTEKNLLGVIGSIGNISRVISRILSGILSASGLLDVLLVLLGRTPSSRILAINSDDRILAILIDDRALAIKYEDRSKAVI